jgi:hypothetical protein
MKAEPELRIVKEQSWEDGVSFSVIDEIDPSCAGRGETFRLLRDAVAYCKRKKVTYKRDKSLDILNG